MIVLYWVSALTGCTKAPPTPIFPIECVYPSYSATSIWTPLRFINCTTYATDYKWYFGDGDSSILFSPTHTYNDTGNYKVIYIAYNKGWKGPSDTMHVRVINPGWYTFKSVTYLMDGSTDIGSGANNWSIGTEASLPDTVISLKVFFQNGLPTQNSIYSVSDSGFSRPGQVFIRLDKNTYQVNPSYFSTGGDGNQHINVTINNNGAVNITATGIMMANASNKSDSALINFAILEY